MKTILKDGCFYEVCPRCEQTSCPSWARTPCSWRRHRPLCGKCEHFGACGALCSKGASDGPR